VTGVSRLVRFRAEWAKEVPADGVPQEGAILTPEARRLVVQSAARGGGGVLIVELAPEAAWRVRVYLSEGPEHWPNGRKTHGKSWEFVHEARDLAGALDAVAEWAGGVLPWLVRPVGGRVQLHFLEPDGLGERRLLDDPIPADYQLGLGGRPTLGRGDRKDILDALEAFCDAAERRFGGPTARRRVPENRRAKPPSSSDCPPSARTSRTSCTTGSGSRS
jgi:hypothetical protein